MKRTSSIKLVLCALCSALATITFMIENLFPSIAIPGARIGVSNVFILLATITLGGTYGYITLTVKVLLGSIFSGNLFAVVYSLPAGIVALTIELLALKFCRKISIICISVCGAVINSLIQNATFCIITATPEFLYYLPYLSLFSVLGGITVGFAVFLIIKIVPNSLFGK